MKSGNQEQICVKLDKSVLASLELEHGVSGLPRNRIINRALVAYTQLLGMARECEAGEYPEGFYRNWFLCVFSKWLTDPSGSMSLVVSEEGGE